MSKQFVSDYKEEVKQLIANNGTNSKANFQSSSRSARFPGANLHYSFSVIPIRAKTGIGKVEEGDRHYDVTTDMDINGNFNENNYVTSSREYGKAIQKRFEEARAKDRNLIIIDETTFLNKSLRSGAV